jgi:recombinational DNA repair protein RecR
MQSLQKQKKIVFFVEPCKMTGQLRKYNLCNACRQRDRDFNIILAHEKIEFVEQYNGMKLVCI